jgi:hypothetical protein
MTTGSDKLESNRGGAHVSNVESQPPSRWRHNDIDRLDVLSNIVAMWAERGRGRIAPRGIGIEHPDTRKSKLDQYVTRESAALYRSPLEQESI